MPIDAPPIPPPKTVIPGAIIAQGKGWHVQGSTRDAVLIEGGRVVARLAGLRHRVSPRGTILYWTAQGGGAVRMIVTYGRCRLPGGGETSHLALLEWRGHRLSGCFSGPVPGEKPILD